MRDEEALTGPELHRAIADAMDAGEGPEVFEIMSEGNWRTCLTWSGIYVAPIYRHQIRRKPTTHTVALGSGERVEVPKPIVEVPELDAANRLLFDDDDDKRRPTRWRDDIEDTQWLADGRLFATREARDQAERALTRILTVDAVRGEDERTAELCVEALKIAQDKVG